MMTKEGMSFYLLKEIIDLTCVTSIFKNIYYKLFSLSSYISSKRKALANYIVIIICACPGE